MFVIQKTLGIDIPHDMRCPVPGRGPVRRNALQPGDLVFFQNTFEPGMSHTGIYIGDGQFIHAETESTGWRISDLVRLLAPALVWRRAVLVGAR